MGSIPRSTPGTFRRLSHIVKISPTRTVLFLSSRRRSDSSCNLSECLRPEDAKNKKINVMIEQLRPSVRITIWSNNPQDFEQLLTHAITVESGLSERPVKKEEKTEKSARESERSREKGLTPCWFCVLIRLKTGGTTLILQTLRIRRMYTSLIIRNSSHLKKQLRLVYQST